MSTIPYRRRRSRRGRRLSPSRRDRAPVDPYGTPHRRRRKLLLAELAAAGTWPCPICGRPMYFGQRLHLHHTNPDAKLAGLPGDALAHALCNLRDGGRSGAATVNSQAEAAASTRAVRHSRVW